MSDELPIVTPEFLSSELDRTIQKPIKKIGGPYTKNDRVKRRNEVFRLHFSIGYSAVKLHNYYRLIDILLNQISNMDILSYQKNGEKGM